MHLPVCSRVQAFVDGASAIFSAFSAQFWCSLLLGRKRFGVRRHFGSRTSLWATFNEVNVQTFCSYIYGSFPPAKIFNFGTAGLVFLHMYQAHIEAYHVIKSLEGD